MVENANYVTVGGVSSTSNVDMIAVRCCSDTSLPGFEGPQRPGCPYAESKFDDVCHNTATYYEAVTVCSDAGARLCTLEEIQNRCARNTGCSHNQRQVWTSTPGP